MNSPAFHENFERQNQDKPGSDRAFCVTFAVIFFLFALLPRASDYKYGLFILGILFFLVGLLRPSWFHYLNRIWHRFGLVLHHLVSPVILLLMYSVAFVPVGILLKIFRFDILNLKIERELKTYWIESEPDGSMYDQF